MTFGVLSKKLINAKVIPILKSGLTDEIGNYRPISLITSIRVLIFLSKILKKFC